MSLKSIINVALSKYVNYYKRAEQVGTVTLTTSAFHFFLEKVSEDEMANELYHATSEVIPIIFHELNLPITLENVVKHVYQNIAMNSGLYNLVSLYKDVDDYPCLLLRHNHGIKWSRISAIHTMRHLEEILRCHIELALLAVTSVVVRFRDKSLLATKA